MLSEKLGVPYFPTAFVSYNALFVRCQVFGDDTQASHVFRDDGVGSCSLPMEAAGWNMFITVSGFIFFFSNFIMVFNMIVSSVRGEVG